MRLIVDVFGDTIIERELLRFSDRALDARPAWLAIMEDFEDEMTQQFDTEGAHASGGWPQLAAATVAYKASHNLDPRILHATLRLRESLTESSGEDAIRMVDPSFMVFGSDVEYGEYHQQGRGVPVRKPFALTEMAKQRAVQTLQRYIVEGEVGFEGLV